MSLICIPRLLALDSATLGKLAADYHHQSDLRRTKATEFLGELNSHGLILAVSLEHLIELLRHENDETVFQRLKFLQSRKILAWVKSTSDSCLPGSFLDIDRLEVSCAIGRQSPDHCEVIDSVRQSLWRVHPGIELIGQVDSFWDAMQEAAKWLGRNVKETASIARTDPGSVRNRRLCEIDGHPLSSVQQNPEAVQSLAADMTEQLKGHGDKKLSDADGIAQQFYAEIQSDIGQIPSEAGDALTAILAFYGLSRDDVTLDMTVGEVSDLWLFRQHLKLLQRRSKTGQLFSDKDLLPEQLPSWTLRQQLTLRQNMAERVEGSNLIDARLAALALYTDFVEVDKRTAEYLRQLKRRHAIGSLLNKTFRCADYTGVFGAIQAVSGRTS